MKELIKAVIASSLILTAGCASTTVDWDGDGVITPLDQAQEFRSQYKLAKSLVVAVAQSTGEESYIDAQGEIRFTDEYIDAMFTLADQLAAQHAREIAEGVEPGDPQSIESAVQIILNAINLYFAEQTRHDA